MCITTKCGLARQNGIHVQLPNLNPALGQRIDHQWTTQIGIQRFQQGVAGIDGIFCTVNHDQHHCVFWLSQLQGFYFVISQFDFVAYAKFGGIEQLESLFFSSQSTGTSLADTIPTEGSSHRVRKKKQPAHMKPPTKQHNEEEHNYLLTAQNNVSWTAFAPSNTKIS